MFPICKKCRTLNVIDGIQNKSTQHVWDILSSNWNDKLKIHNLNRFVMEAHVCLPRAVALAVVFFAIEKSKMASVQYLGCGRRFGNGERS